mgnify:FL=1
MSKTARPLVAALFVALLAAAILWLMGRPPICTCGQIDWWVNSPTSPKTSQMLADWYSPSHLIHGFLFYGLLHLTARKMPMGRRFLMATVIEAAWEVVENSPVIINRYREATMALGYTGDSILNSMSDIAMMAIGFLLARKLPVWASVAIVIGFEVLTLHVIRDNLTLNVWMLLAPNNAIRDWQADGPGLF